MEMKVGLRKDGSTGIVRMKGELDHHTARTVREQVDDFIESADINRLIFDLKELTFMDSSGIGVLLGRYKEMKKRGGKVCVKNLNPRMDKIFVLSGLYQVIIKLD